MTAEAIARVVDDLRRGRVQMGPLDHQVSIEDRRHLLDLALSRIASPTVVDATAIYRSLVAKEGDIYLYEDHPCIAPPWNETFFAYQNEHGNVIAMHSSTASEIDPAHEQRWDTAQEIDWDRVRWRLSTFVWVGGSSSVRGPLPTTGPAFLWQFAIYEDGTPADIRWVDLTPGYPRENWAMASCVLLGSLNFLNCSNVEAVEPQRPRSERRRLDKLGVKVRTIAVRPMGRSARGAGGGQSDTLTPLTTVRGSFHHYGPEFGRGLLFGKIAGRFWVPGFARGKAEHGEVRHDYRLAPRGEER